MSERDVERVLADAAASVESPSEDDLRALARSAAANDRPARAGRRRRLTPGRAAAAVVVALVAGSALGFGLASSLTASGGAAESAPGLGFMPERGWNVARSGFEASEEQPSFAFAANVPFHRIDLSLARRPESSGAPYRTLQALGPNGVVLVASFSVRGVHEPTDGSFPQRALPLRLRDASSRIRPVYFPRRLGLYELRAAVGEHNVIVDVYFGTLTPSRALVISAQRQLDRLVVGSTRPSARVSQRAFPLQPSAGPAVPAARQSRTFDRTFSCLPLSSGARTRDLDLLANPAREDTASRHFVGLIEARSGAALANTSLVFARAAVQQQFPGLASSWPVKGAAGVFANRHRCRANGASVPLSARGLSGPAIRWQKELDCAVRGRVLVRIRARLAEPTTWRRMDRTYAGARNPVVRAQLAVRSERTGKPIAYMELDAKGGTKLWYSGTCS